MVTMKMIMIYLRPMRKKWVKEHGSGEIEKYIMKNGHHGSRKLFESPDISKEMWCKDALRKEFKAQWWWRAPEKRREKCYSVVNASNTRYSASTWGPQPISGMPDELLKNDAYGEFRGTGVLIFEENEWKISQYNLLLPIPNDYLQKYADEIKKYYAKD